MATASKKRKQQQRQATVRILILAAILAGINMLAARFHSGLDLTKEKRFTLSPATKKMLGNMQDVAVVTVYLQGKNFPVVFKRLQDATRERLQTFRDYAGAHIVFRFIDPLADKSDDEKSAMYQQLGEKGILPTGINSNKDQSYTQQLIFPYALVSYHGKEMAVKLIDNDMGMIGADAINNAEALLEYKLANAIHVLSLADKPRIAYITGHGEPLNVQTYDMLTTLAKYYFVDTIDLPNNYYISSAENVIIINKPKTEFNDKEKFKIDQYVMNGGHVLWAIDMLQTPMDSLMRSQQFLALDYGLNLDDILFKYGVRINPALVEDLQCSTIPLVNNSAEKAQVFFSNWIYFPLFTPTSHHPIVNNMDAVMGIFTNSIDTIANPNINKTILLASSKYSRTTPSPVRVNLQMIKYKPRPELFNKPYQPVAVLLEGKFGSIFRNRIPPDFLRILRDSLHHPFKAYCDTQTSMIVVSDGDMFTNDFTPRTGPLEMGFWQYADPPAHYANKSFFLNCIEYLADNSGLLEARSKDLRLRLLDGARVTKEKSTWQIVNVGIPIALVLVFASVYLFFRKRRYEKKSSTAN